MLEVAFFWDSLFADRMPFWRDVYTGLLTWPPFASMAMKTDEWIILWNPFLGGGKPWLADPHYGFLYPLNFIYHVIPPAKALLFSVMLHMYIFGASSYALLRHWKFGIAASLFGSITMMFGTLFVSLMDFRDQFAAIAWGPLVQCNLES
jgi:hypothetical protein